MFQQLILGRGRLDRSAELRTDPQAIAGLRDHADRFVVGVHGGSVVLADTHLRNLTDARLDAANSAFLGMSADRPVFALFLDHLPDAHASSLRDCGEHLADDEVAIATAATALHQWHLAHPRCARCGAETELAAAGWERVCAADGRAHYPRTDPAVIVRIVDDADRLLLARQPVWAPGRYSLVAGYVEPGETAEHAVAREVLEEVGVNVDDVRFLASQPWPFPASLMLCFEARALHTDVQVDGVEIEHAQWLTREELATACTAGTLSMPSRVSIARWAIEQWFGSPLPGEW